MTFDPRNVTPRSDELANRVIAITGPTRGIGRAIALGCAKHGASVILIGRNKNRLEGVHSEIEAAGGEATIAMLDLERATAPDYDELAAGILARYGRLDSLLHNAGVLGAMAPIEHYDVPTWCRVMHVNVTAAFALTQVLLPALKQSVDASVLVTSSTLGKKGRAYWGAYSVSKFAVEGLTQILAAELENVSSIRVNAINPGATRTPMRQQAFPSEDPTKLQTPEDLLPVYLALLGPASRGVTGMSFNAMPDRPAAR
jgi:NAD(P)-dependent dehydrogenase (short-subunit alcohol dehydrogenase family)